MWIIASRESRLALWQAQHVQQRLMDGLGAEVSILGMTTRGDQILDRSLAKVGGKGLFTKELEVALAEGRARLAVHSLKDVPMQLPEGFVLAAVMSREDPRDALVSAEVSSLAELPAGAKVGTSSLRRESQIRAAFPHLEVVPLRGNLDTRLAKLDRGDMQAIILAAAGLKRLGMVERIRALIPQEEMLPAAGQGALGIEMRADDAEGIALVKTCLDCPRTHREVLAERAVSRALGGSCQIPLAAFCDSDPVSGLLQLRARLSLPDGSSPCRISLWGDDPEALGLEAAQALRKQGADAVMQALGAPAA